GEVLLPVACARLLRPAAPAFAGARQHVAFDELLVPRQHPIADAAAAAPQPRLIHSVERDGDLAALHDVLDVAPLRRVLDGALHHRLGSTQKPLTILETLAARVETAVNDVHGSVSRPASRACTIQPSRGPDPRSNPPPSCPR